MDQLELTEADIARFWAKVNKDGPIPAHRPEIGPCWVWRGSLPIHRYPQFYLRGRVYRASHVALAVDCRFVPAGLVAAHECDNPECVRASHLSLLTQGENMADASRRGRLARRRRPIGERHPAARLTWDDVREIRRRRAAGESSAVISQDYNISPSQVRNIGSGKSWNEEEYTREMRRREMTPAKIVALQTLIANGEPIAELARLAQRSPDETLALILSDLVTTEE